MDFYGEFFEYTLIFIHIVWDYEIIYSYFQQCLTNYWLELLECKIEIKNLMKLNQLLDKLNISKTWLNQRQS